MHHDGVRQAGVQVQDVRSVAGGQLGPQEGSRFRVKIQVLPRYRSRTQRRCEFLIAELQIQKMSNKLQFALNERSSASVLQHLSSGGVV